MPEKEWFTMQELAEMFGVSYYKIRQVVATLSNTGAIVTRENPADNRILEIQKDSIDKIRVGVFGK
jgi:DNA-binding GntR family transcriptional regulator